MNNLIIGACFLVAVLAIVGLVFALRGSDKAEAEQQATAPTTASKETAPLAEEASAPDESQTFPVTAPEALPQTETIVARAPEPPNDEPETQYPVLPTLRSINASNHEDTTLIVQDERTQATYDHLQTLLDELRGLHTQMENMQQRINVLTDQVTYLRGNDGDEEQQWHVSPPSLRVPAK